jgi:excinuclease ABC subunit B
LQIAHNKAHHIIPQTIRKPVREKEVDLTDTKHLPKSEIPNLIIELEAEMQAAADALDFERAIKLRDVVKKLRVQAAG